MRKITYLKFTMGVALLGTLIFYGCNISKNEQVKADFLRRHAYKQQELDDLRNRIRPLTEKLLLLMDDSSKISNDSAKLLLRRSFFVLSTCENKLYEIQQLEKDDSVLFQMYSR